MIAVTKLDENVGYVGYKTVMRPLNDRYTSPVPPCRCGVKFQTRFPGNPAPIVRPPVEKDDLDLSHSTRQRPTITGVRPQLIACSSA